MQRLEPSPLAISELFEQYRRSGFLYPAKLDRLAPVLPLIEANWKAACGANHDLMRVMVFGNPARGPFGSIASWQSSAGSWVDQHLVAKGGVAAEIGCSMGWLHAEEGHKAAQFWYRPTNPFPERVLGETTRGVDAQNMALADFAYAAFDRTSIDGDRGAKFRAAMMSTTDAAGVASLLASWTDPAAVEADAIRVDPQLEAMDVLYRSAGLRRYRRIVSGFGRSTSEPLAFMIVYRGPLGLNFSFLENRTELYFSPSIGPDAQALARLLLAHASSYYDDFELPWIPVVVPERQREYAERVGLRVLRTYRRSVLVGAGIAGWAHAAERFVDARAARLKSVAQRVRRSA